MQKTLLTYYNNPILQQIWLINKLFFYIIYVNILFVNNTYQEKIWINQIKQLHK